MKTSMTWSPAAGLNVVSVEAGEQAWTVTVDSQQATFSAGCGAPSKSRHSTYWRTFRDLSAQGAPVVVNARLGRWRCREPFWRGVGCPFGAVRGGGRHAHHCA